jgi:pimeloyl-ACP methyl ester carboxylesterase
MSRDHAESVMKHGMAQIEPGLRIHYVTAGAGDRTIVLVHGFPQTWWEWRHVMPLLVQAGFRVIALDYRRAGASSRPQSGYDKRSMATDIHVLLHEHLQVQQAVIMVGHDIGSMVAFAYAEMFREEVSHLLVMDAPLPGTAIFDRLRSDPRVWHFAFHGARDIPEMLVAGRERPYLQAFFNARIFDPSGVSESDLDIYTSAYSAPGAMRAGFETYRSFDQDARANRDAVERNGKLTIPVLAVWGEISNTGPGVEAMMHEVAEHVAGFQVAASAHWIAEENPEAFAAGLLQFLASSDVRLENTTPAVT